MSNPMESVPYEVHLCADCIDMLYEHDPYHAHNLLIVEVPIDQCDNGLLDFDPDIYNTTLNARNAEFDPNADALLPMQVTIISLEDQLERSCD